MADLAALAGQYKRAIDAYEQVALASLNSNLTKWSVKDYYLKAGACYLAGKDPVATKQAIERYVVQDPTFTSTRECILLEVLPPRRQLTSGFGKRRG
jgi:alpha-soluble NSF attachment protein